MLLVQVGDSLTDVLSCQYIVHGCKMKQAAASWVALCNWSSIPKQTSHNHSLSSLSATRWFK